ncbi:MAG: hypothetical protein ABIK31_07940, partial [candidate division WOR-3 bacterium]
MFRIFVVATLSLIALSCKQFDMFLHPHHYIPRDSPREKEYIYDTVFIHVAEPGVKVVTNPNLKPSKQLIFDRVGQSYSFRDDEVLMIV